MVLQYEFGQLVFKWFTFSSKPYPLAPVFEPVLAPVLAPVFGSPSHCYKSVNFNPIDAKFDTFIK